MLRNRDSGEWSYLRDGGEEVVRDLVVECAAEEGHDGVAVAVVDRALDLRDGPLIGDLVLDRVAQRVVTLRRHVAHLHHKAQQRSGVGSQERAEKQETRAEDMIG